MGTVQYSIVFSPGDTNREYSVWVQHSTAQYSHLMNRAHFQATTAQYSTVFSPDESRALPGHPRGQVRRNALVAR
jgi:hypothetical protein